MANNAVFGNRPKVPDANTVNNAGGLAYASGPRLSLAQYVATGTFNDTFYVGAKTQLDELLHICDQVGPEFIAKCAIHARTKSYMKDTPALLCAVLFCRAKNDDDARVLFEKVFDAVIDNGKMLRNFVQIIRSGVLPRKSFGSHGKRCINQWISKRGCVGLFWDSVGNKPSMADVIRMSHPKPESEQEAATYRYIIGRDLTPEQEAALPRIITEYEAFKADPVGNQIPKVPFQMLDSLPLSEEQWKEIFRNGKWQFTRMNIATAARHGVLKDKEMVRLIADRIKDPELINAARAFPYQLLMAWSKVSEKDDVPQAVKNALQDALDLAVDNVPDFGGRAVRVLLDTSGSMHSPVTGYRAGATTEVTCVDVAALVATAILRKGEDVRVLPFDTVVHNPGHLNPRDSVVTLAKHLAGYGGGGTSISAPLLALNDEKDKGDVVILVSDNESWFDGKCEGVLNHYMYSYMTGRDLQAKYGGEVPAMVEWQNYKRRNKGAKLVCIDLTPSDHHQFEAYPDILRIGGFSDTIWSTISNFLDGKHGPDLWLAEIEEVQL